MDALLDVKVIAAVVAGLCGLTGAWLGAIYAPRIKAEGDVRRAALEIEERERTRKRERIAAWRSMINQVHSDVTGANPRSLLQVHPDFLELEPLLSDTARSEVYGTDWSTEAGAVLPGELLAIQRDIARIEREWDLA